MVVVVAARAACSAYRCRWARLLSTSDSTAASELCTPTGACCVTSCSPGLPAVTVKETRVEIGASGCVTYGSTR
jgi:hypothetical protein